MKRRVTILQGQLQNFILFSLKDKGGSNYWTSKMYRKDLNYIDKYVWGYSKEDEKILMRFLDEK